MSDVNKERDIERGKRANFLSFGLAVFVKAIGIDAIELVVWMCL